MRILFVGMCSHYTIGLNYQDNQFCKYFVERGDEVVYISDPNEYIDGKLVYVGEKNEKINNSFHLFRKDYLFKLLSFICSKLKLFKSIYRIIENFKPDIIYCHGTQYISVYDVVRYKKKNPHVLIYADTHTGYYNIDTHKWYFALLYKFYYKKLYKVLEPYLEKNFYIGPSDKQFGLDVFNADEKIMEYLPLGGFAIKDEIYNKYRKSKRNELGFGDDDVVIVHSGKLDEKKHTDWLIDAVNSVNNNRIKLVIIGSIPSSNAKLHDLIKNNKNSNILYLGWKNSSELIEYICAGDIYAQPGTQSITFNNSICCQTPIIAYKYDLYSYFYDVSSIIWIKSIDDLKNCLFTIVNDESILANLKTEAISNKNLIDYNKVLFKLMDLKR